MIKAVLFDLDGVLIDLQTAWFNLLNAMCKHFGREGFTEEYFINNVWGITSHDAANKYFANFEFRDIDNFIRKNLLNYSKYILPMPDVENVLKEIKEKKFKIATATNTPTKLTAAILDRFNIRNYFDLIMARDLVENSKPAPDMIFKACEELGINVSEAIFIGDTEVDKIAAKNANCLFVGYNIDGDKRINDLKELLKIII